MYDLEEKKDFIVIRGSDIINEVESKELCKEIIKVVNSNSKNLLFDVRQVNLADSNFDICVQYLSKLEVDKIALVLEDLISGFKFKLWKRRYQNYVTIKQFNILYKAQEWLRDN
ncbi:hypothetical protein JCM16358_12150 [Halanaerocella petrolearia]